MIPFRRRFLPPLGPPRLSPGQRALAEWRGVNQVELDKAAALQVRSAAEVMRQVTARLRLDQRRAETELLRVWNQVLDPTVTAHAQPAGLVRGTLFVDVDSNVWLSEIVRYRRREILERLQHSFGPELVRKISFRVG